MTTSTTTAITTSTSPATTTSTSTSTSTSTAYRTADTLVHDLFHIIDNRTWNNLTHIFTDDAVYERPGYPPLLGLHQILHFYQHQRIIATGHHHIDHTTSNLNTAACWGHFHGTTHTGQPLHEPFADTYITTNNKITHRKTFFWRPAI
ncbi:nuclear transport factor 2 family protein [Streptacidiphilus cavernicola]|uniref:Nuclear transport factor 2 family protein n=1 Tax=Streptacidiphilus cavernicola TaxID=3342716 RepID=A0ABV6VPF2_9ACTN